MADPLFAVPRLAEIYDPLESDRVDLELYLSLLGQLGARSVLDIGCGTGTFACLLSQRGVRVTGVDPAPASLDVARRKPHADSVLWILGDATTLPSLQVDVATMTGNVAMVFLTDEEWSQTLHGVHAALRPHGSLLFEVRDPGRDEWRQWTRDQSHRQVMVEGVGTVQSWVEITDVSLPLVSFRMTFVFEADGAVLTSDSTLRYRSRAEIGESLVTAGFVVKATHDAPDRPGREIVFVAQRPEAHTTSGV